MDAEQLSYYSSQSAVTTPGAMSCMLADLPSDLDGLRRIAHQLVIHFRLDDLDAAGVAADRLGEVDTRYADAMLARLDELGPDSLAAPRAPGARLVGCCRDFTVLFLTMARATGIPARARVGFAGYFFEGVKIDHVVAEVWDAGERRWRLVDPQLGDDHSDPTDGERVDPGDLPRDRFLTAGAAWQRSRAGDEDPSTFVVRPETQLAALRGMPYICHNLTLDLAALNKVEMILWDIWGIGGRGFAWDRVTDEEMDLLDEVARTTADTVDAVAATRLYADARLRVPQKLMSVDPLALKPRKVVLRDLTEQEAA